MIFSLIIISWFVVGWVFYKMGYRDGAHDMKQIALSKIRERIVRNQQNERR